MELQRILFPKAERCKESELYFRAKAGEKTEEAFVLPKGERVSFDTYFNSFSIEKWNRYTVVSSVFLKLKLSGKWKLFLLNIELRNGTVCEKVLAEHVVETQTPAVFEFVFEEEEKRGIYAFRAVVLSEEGSIYGGAYCSDLSNIKQQNVKIGVCICTYKREEYVERNLRTLEDELLSYKESPVFEHLEIFVVDNGRSLDQEALQTDRIHLYPNRNLGGAGGFTRGLIEIYHNNSAFNITHVLFMDDDVVIEPEAIVRTYMILSLIRKEYEDAFIGGAMLSLDRPYMQTESGAVWNGGKIKQLKSNMDMRQCECCLYNECEENAEYNAWWFCCFPIAAVNDDNLPLPLFIRMDDIEYGLRNMRQLISMNGICVWHESFENKCASYLEYYIARNQLITNAFHCKWYGTGHLIRKMLSKCVQEIMLFQYKRADLYLQGILDFLKGPEWLAAQDGEKLHDRIVSMGYMAETKTKRFYLFSSLKCILKMFGVMIQVTCRYKRAQESYAVKGKTLMTLAFWNDYLN